MRFQQFSLQSLFAAITLLAVFLCIWEPMLRRWHIDGAFYLPVCICVPAAVVASLRNRGAVCAGTTAAIAGFLTALPVGIHVCHTLERYGYFNWTHNWWWLVAYVAGEAMAGFIAGWLIGWGASLVRLVVSKFVRSQNLQTS